MPTYTVQNKQTGKTYKMPWNDPTRDPTEDDVASFVGEQDKPGFMERTGLNVGVDRLKKDVQPVIDRLGDIKQTPGYDTMSKAVGTADKIRSTPLTDYLPEYLHPSKIAEKYVKPITEEGMAHPDSLMGKAKMYGGAFGESLLGQAEATTRPDMLALIAATGGAGKLATAGFGKTAAALAVPGQVLGGKMAYEGGKEALNAPTWGGKVAGGVQAALGAAGALYNPGLWSMSGYGDTLPKNRRDIAPEPFGPEPAPEGYVPPKVSRPRAPRAKAAAAPPVEAAPAEAPPLQSIAPPGPVPIRNWSGAQARLRKPPVPPVEAPPMAAATPYSAAVKGVPEAIPEMAPPIVETPPVVKTQPKQPLSTEGATNRAVDPELYSKLSDNDLDFLAKHGNKDAIAATQNRPTLKEKFAAAVQKIAADQRGSVKMWDGGLGPVDEMSRPGPWQEKVAPALDETGIKQTNPIKYEPNSYKAPEELAAAGQKGLPDVEMLHKPYPPKWPRFPMQFGRYMEAAPKEPPAATGRQFDLLSEPPARTEPRMSLDFDKEARARQLERGSDASINKVWDEAKGMFVEGKSPVARQPIAPITEPVDTTIPRIPKNFRPEPLTPAQREADVQWRVENKDRIKLIQDEHDRLYPTKMTGDDKIARMEKLGAIFEEDPHGQKHSPDSFDRFMTKKYGRAYDRMRRLVTKDYETPTDEARAKLLDPLGELDEDIPQTQPKRPSQLAGPRSSKPRDIPLMGDLTDTDLNIAAAQGDPKAELALKERPWVKAITERENAKPKPQPLSKTLAAEGPGDITAEPEMSMADWKGMAPGKSEMDIWKEGTTGPKAGLEDIRRPPRTPEDVLRNLKGGDVVPGSGGRKLLDTSRPYEIWKKETERMGYPADEIDMAKKTADHFGEDITRSDDLHDFNSYMEDKHGQAYIDHVDSLMGEDSSAGLNEGPRPKAKGIEAETLTDEGLSNIQEENPFIKQLKHILGDEEGAVRLKGGLKGRKVGDKTAAQRFAEKFGLPTDEEVQADMAGRKDPSLVAENTMEEPARKMGLREKLGQAEMKLRGKMGEGKGNNEEGALKIFQKKPSTPELKLQEDNHFNAKNWSTERAAAREHGRMDAKDFADLKAGGMDLVEAFAKGDRSGRLADVQKWLDRIYAEEQAAGIEVGSKSSFAQKLLKPQFVGKDRTPLPSGVKIPKTYKAGAEQGLLPKYNNLTDLIEEKTQRSKVAQADKRFDTYLEQTQQKKPYKFDKFGKPVYASVDDPRSLDLTGAEEAKLHRYIVENVHGKGDKYLNRLGSGVAKTKNISLAGGVAGTPLNMHGSNIGRSLFQVMGKDGVTNFLKGVVKPGWLESESERLRPLVREALDKGYQVTGEAESIDPLTEWLDKYKIGRALNKGMKWEEKWFEDPLFKRALPAWKAQVLEARVNALEKSGRGLTRDQILREASSQANDFMGGQNTTLRNKNWKNLAQTAFLAPDWAESQLNKSVKGYKALVGREDPIYRDAMVRSGGLRLAGGALNTALGDERGEHASDLTTVGLGRTSSGRFREAALYGGSSLGMSIPEEALRAGIGEGDWSAAAKVAANRLSQPAQSLINIVRSEDAYGNPLTGEDKFGRKIPGLTSLANYLDEAGKPFTPQQVQALISLGRGKQGPEEAFMQSIEFPFKYSAPPKPKGGGRTYRR